jgi:EAL domain-containing protein (putative c-di-GMP-specific phosphodiesterase class I)
VVERLNLINCLKGALERDEFYLYYQPQYDARSSRIVGLEVLLRWENRHLGMVPPSRFISVAEETRLIIPIGEYVLRSALAFLRKLRGMGHDQLTMCINISIIQLMQKDFTGMVLNILKENSIPSGLLELEITESVMMESASVVLENIEDLRKAGVRIALDDFGTGYSSLNYLMDLPINTLKIDKSFIGNIGHGKENQLLVSTIMNIGRRLGLSTVAEGVEHREQLEYLIRRKCERVQGFLLSKPLPQAEIELLL